MCSTESISLSVTSSNQLFSLLREDISNLEALSPKATRVILVQHGECFNNLKDIMGSLCPDDTNGLTLKGREQASLAGKRLYVQIGTTDAIITSPNTRAKETALLVAEALRYPLDKIVTDTRLQEENFGPVEGLPFPSFKEALGNASRFVGGVPGGETGDQVMQRMSHLFSEIANSHDLHGKTVVCFTHWFPIAQA